MGMLTKLQKREMAVAHCKIFEAVCDEPDCMKLVPAGGLYIVLKWKKLREVTPGLPDRLYKVPAVIRCMDCQARKEGREPGEAKKLPKVKGKKKSMTVEEVEKLIVDPILKKALIRQIKKRMEKAPPSTDELYLVIKKKKVFHALKRKDFNSALRKLKKLYLVKYSKKHWLLRK